MRACRFIVYLLILFNLIACTSFHKQEALRDKRIEYLSRQLKGTQEKIKRLKSANLILQKKAKIAPSEVKPPLDKKNQTLNPMSETSAAVSLVSQREKDLFKEVISSYRKKNGDRLNYYVNQLVKEYPKGLYGDNALYLYGKYLYQSKNYSLALNYLSRALQLFPKGNKRVSILLEKSIIYIRLGQGDQARTLLREIVNQHPHSVEASQAEMELKLLSGVGRKNL